MAASHNLKAHSLRVARKDPLRTMTSTQALALTTQIIENDSEIAAPLLILVDAFLNARGDPMSEKMALDVKRYLYSKTEHSDDSMARFIAQASRLSGVAA